MSACGTDGGLAVHKRRNEPPCIFCRRVMDAPPERKKPGPAKGTPAKMGAPLAPCGTNSAYQRHRARGEQSDPACDQAHRDYNAERRAKKRQAKEGTQ